MKVFKFAAGLAIGYVLGSRAGRDKYDQIAAAARRAQNHPAVKEMQQKAGELLGTTGDSASTDTNPVSVEAPTTAASAGPVPPPPRRQPRTALAVPDVATDPLA